MSKELLIKDLYVSYSHYLLNHDSCGSPHGHTGFINDISIDIEDVELDESGISIDFGIIKTYFKKWHHKNIVPQIHYAHWLEFYKKMGFKDNLIPLPHSSCEVIKAKMKEELSILLNLPEEKINFEFWEGPGGGL